MIFSFVIVIYFAVQDLLAPSPTGWLIPGLVIAGMGLLVNGFFWQRDYFLNKKESSPIFEAQWRLYRSKTLIDFCVFFTLMLNLKLEAREWSQYIDFIGSIIISGFLLVSGIYLVKNALKSLADRAPFDIDKIKEKLEPLPEEARGLRKIRCRQAGGKIIIEVLIIFEPECRMEDINGVLKNMTERLESNFPQSQIQIFPVSNDFPEG